MSIFVIGGTGFIGIRVIPLLVARGDSNALGQAITQLLNDGALRGRWQESCEAWVKERFSFERNAGAYHTLYESLLQKK